VGADMASLSSPEGFSGEGWDALPPGCQISRVEFFRTIVGLDTSPGMYVSITALSTVAPAAMPVSL